MPNKNEVKRLVDELTKYDTETIEAVIEGVSEQTNTSSIIIIKNPSRVKLEQGKFEYMGMEGNCGEYRALGPAKVDVDGEEFEVTEGQTVRDCGDRVIIPEALD